MRLSQVQKNYFLTSDSQPNFLPSSYNFRFTGAIFCLRRLRNNILSCAVVVVSIVLVYIPITSSATSVPGSGALNASGLSIGILVAESCDESFRTSMKQTIDKALEDFITFVSLTDGVGPSSGYIHYTIYPFCETRDVISNLDAIFGNDSIQLILSISTYDIHSSLIPLAEIYNKGYISVNIYIFTLAQTPSISLAPRFSQSGLMLAKVLDIYKWEDIAVIFTNFNLWMNFATYMYYAMTSYNFKVTTWPVLTSPLTSENAKSVLRSASEAKVILLLMDVNDQLFMLATASSLSMTTRHAFFAFTKTPYDINFQSLIGVEPAILKQPNFFQDLMATNVNIMESVFVVASTFPVPASKNNSTAAKITKREIRVDTSVEKFGAEIKDNSENYTDKNKARHRGFDENTKQTGSYDNSRHTDSNDYSRRTNNNDNSKHIESNDNFRHVGSNNNASHIVNIYTKQVDSTNHMYISSNSKWPPNYKKDHLFPSFNSSDYVSYSRLKRDIEKLQTSDPDLRTKRDIEKLQTSDSDLFAVYDIVFLLALSAHVQSRRNNATLVSEGLITSLANLSFPGHSGSFSIDQRQQVKYDFSLYDFDAKTGAMKERIFFQATTSDSWMTKEELAVDWPGEVELSPDECFKQLPGCNSGIKMSIIAGIVVAALAVVAVVIVAFVAARRHWVNKEMTKGPNKVILSQEDLVFVLRKEVAKGSRVMKSRVTLLDKDSAPDLIRASEPNRSLASINELNYYTETARYNGDLVYIKELHIKGFEMKNNLLTYIRLCRDLRHENLNPYVGFLSDVTHPSIVTEFCSRGSLYDVIHNEDFKLDWDFKLSLLTDLVRGLRYLHSSPLKCHGHMTSKSCVIDSRFVLKVTDYGVPGIMEKCKTTRSYRAKDLLWSAPELLRDDTLFQHGSDKGDIYAMSIIFQEVALRTEPYSTTGLSAEEIVKKLKKPPPLIRPSVTPQAGPPLFIQIMKQCWSESPEMRPGLDDIYDQFKKLTGGKKANIVDTMFKMLEKYSTDLEDIVAERTMQLEEEKKKTDQLLCRMLPPTVAENLKIGRTVEAECFDEVTIYFSDIVGFTTISAMSTPMQVVDLLNDLYSMFDATINNHDVYKVETIGDAYMVVSGLPVRNGNRHAGEIGNLSLVLLSQCGKFTIRHMPHLPLKIRIGLHTGSCVAGVVGLTMPRFCLFGDTVNTASRMESSGAAFRVHISDACKTALDVLGGYNTEYRGQTELKGKGLYNTYWLVGREGFDLDLPEPPPLTGDNTHGLDSILGDLKLNMAPGLELPQNDVISKSSSAPNLAPSNKPACNDPPMSNKISSSTSGSQADYVNDLHKHNKINTTITTNPNNITTNTSITTTTNSNTTTNSSVVAADANFIDSTFNSELSQTSTGVRNGAPRAHNQKTHQGWLKDGTDTGLASDSNHFEGKEKSHDNRTPHAGDLPNGEQFQRSHLQTNNRNSQQSNHKRQLGNHRNLKTSPLTTVSRQSCLSLDVEDVTMVTEV